MTVPQEYEHASRDFDRLLLDVREAAMLQTTHQAYHTLRAVLHVFRAHLTLTQALTFADVLPPVVRAIFVESWKPADAPPPFPSRPELQREVKAQRPDHNLAPDTAISDVAAALRRAVDEPAFEHALAGLPDGAREFWDGA